MKTHVLQSAEAETPPPLLGLAAAIEARASRKIGESLESMFEMERDL